jgi:hypothetical protein
MDSVNTKKVVDGEVILVDKPSGTETIPLEISHEQAKALKPKRELSQAQKENLARLIEKNKAKAEERKKQLQQIPDQIPEDKVPVIVKAKRNYKKDVERKIVADRLASLEQLMKGFVTDEFRNQDIKGNIVPILEKEKDRKPRLKNKPKRPPTPTSEESESETETETESELDEKTKRYIRKAQVRMDTVKQIEQTLQRPPNRYSNMSIF